jgi:hypothetical protein
MELRHLYSLSEMICDGIEKDVLPKDIKDNIEITMSFSPTTFYGIDKEFYYITHDNSYEGFEHSKDMVTATVNGIKFNILPKIKEQKTK